ncbi:MAG: efflux RND transporter periplasmic adaptor subunit [Oscillatoriophycideae cyanobacterium NC_groundwater_1537_Pr4_S-0.65um_50_18]|nr:efflux RND transporter periplasmic adaptor subunit [Oscillatoriophycideae cyanobacterium NC_groundwater_1537_Pr4_S-0.65um_50_18]
MKLDSPPQMAPQPFVKNKMKQAWTRWLVGLLALSLFAGGGYAIYRQMRVASRQEARRQMQTMTVKRTTLPITITANGTVQPKQSTNVSPKDSGRLKSIIVEEGDSVEAGQILAYMDASDLQGQLLSAQGQLASAEANLQKAIAGNRPQEVAQSQAQLKSAEANLRQAESDLQRNQQLYSEGAISAQTLDTFRTTRDTAKADVEQAQQTVDLSQAGSRQEDIAEARAQVTQAEGGLKTVETQIDDAVIRAPFSGTITKRYADPGDFVAPTTSASDTSSATSSSILSLASTYQVVAKVAETDIARIKVGLPVTLQADAYPDQTFEGRVAQVAAEATVTSNVTSFDIKIDILSDKQRLLRPGMNVDVEFKAGELTNVLTVPTVAIVRQPEGEGVMIITESGNPQFTPIKTGATVGNETEVRSGLQDSQQILLSAPPSASQSPAGNRLPIPGLNPGRSRSRS